MLAWEDSYVGQLRAVVGNRKLITPSTRAVILDEAGRVLLVRRSETAHGCCPPAAWSLTKA